MNSIFRFAAAPLIGVVVVLGLVGGEPRRTANKATQDTSSVENVESNLTFNDVTLEQADEQGRSVWKVKAEEATYSKDKKVAHSKPTGELFQDGKPVYQIIASRESPAGWQAVVSQGQIVASPEWLGVAWQ